MQIPIRDRGIVLRLDPVYSEQGCAYNDKHNPEKNGLSFLTGHKPEGNEQEKRNGQIKPLLDAQTPRHIVEVGMRRIEILAEEKVPAKSVRKGNALYEVIAN